MKSCGTCDRSSAPDAAAASVTRAFILALLACGAWAQDPHASARKYYDDVYSSQPEFFTTDRTRFSRAPLPDAKPAVHSTSRWDRAAG